MALQTPPQGTRRRVLLVEDDDGVRRSMHLALHGQGYDVRSYSTAAALLSDPTIDQARMLIADYRLGDGDGLGVRQALEARGWQGRSVLVTAFPSPELRKSARDAGYDAVLDKPVRQHDLIGALEGSNHVS